MFVLFGRARTLALTVGLVVRGLVVAQAENAPPVLIAYACAFQLEMLVGQYDPHARRWLSNTHAFVPPAAGSPVTLFGVNGKLAVVHIDESYRTRPDIQPWDWNVAISSWSRAATHVALALSGQWPDLPHPPQVLPLTDVDAVNAVSAFLKERTLDVPSPTITEIYQVDLNGDGQEEKIICANTDTSKLTDAAPAAIYSLALLRVSVNGQLQTLPLRADAAYKPANRSLDEHQRLHGRTAFYQALALSDVIRDGHEQIAILNNNRYEGPEMDLFSFGQGKVRHLLSTRKLYL